MQDGSLRLFLAIMVGAAPPVARAVVTGAGGDQYFGAYLPDYGVE